MEFKDKRGWQHWEGQQHDLPGGMLKRLWDASGSYKQDYRPDEAKGLAALKSRMEMEQPTPTRIVRLSPRKILVRVAASIALLAFGIWVFKAQFGEPNNWTAQGTSQNGTKELTLSDGSIVSLNRTSELAYQADFTKKERRVKLKGEAFFQVSRDENRPFIIEIPDAEVRVLGTSFNVRSYPNEDFFEVFVESGKVRVDIAKQHIELSKGEFFRFDKTTEKAVTGIDNSGIPAAWRNGAISFKGQPIPIVLLGMERLYGVNIDLKTEQKSDCLQTLTMQKGKLSEAMDALKTSCPKMKFTKEAEGMFSVSGSCCN